MWKITFISTFILSDDILGLHQLNILDSDSILQNFHSSMQKIQNSFFGFFRRIFVFYYYHVLDLVWVLGQHLTPAVCLYLLQPAFGLIWSTNNLTSTWLYSHLLGLWQFFEFHYLPADQNNFGHWSWHCNLLFLLLEGNTLHVLFCLIHFQTITEKFCWLLEILDYSGNLDSSLNLY